MFLLVLEETAMIGKGQILSQLISQLISLPIISFCYLFFSLLPNICGSSCNVLN
jgi:hypothetical protein